MRPARWFLLGAGCGRRDDGGGMRGREAVTEAMAASCGHCQSIELCGRHGNPPKGAVSATTGEMQ